MELFRQITAAGELKVLKPARGHPIAGTKCIHDGKFAATVTVYYMDVSKVAENVYAVYYTCEVCIGDGSDSKQYVTLGLSMKRHALDAWEAWMSTCKSITDGGLIDDAYLVTGVTYLGIVYKTIFLCGLIHEAINLSRACDAIKQRISCYPREMVVLPDGEAVPTMLWPRNTPMPIHIDL